MKFFILHFDINMGMQRMCQKVHLDSIPSWAKRGEIKEKVSYGGCWRK